LRLPGYTAQTHDVVEFASIIGDRTLPDFRPVTDRLDGMCGHGSSRQSSRQSTIQYINNLAYIMIILQNTRCDLLKKQSLSVRGYVTACSIVL
jgi:hypothetical protein